MAHKKGQGSSKNGRDSQGQRRGVKRYAGEQVTVVAASPSLTATPNPASDPLGLHAAMPS